MRKFRFRLARLEKLREARKRASRLAVAEALEAARRRSVEREAADHDAERSLEVELPQASAGDVRTMRQLEEWRAGLRHAARAAAERELTAQAQAGRIEDEYRQVAREHRVIEILRERRHREWLEESTREEQKFLDENFLLRHGRGDSPRIRDRRSGS